MLPALLRRLHEAKATGQTEVELGGSGTPRREFLPGDALAAACLFLFEHYDSEQWLNVG